MEKSVYSVLALMLLMVTSQIAEAGLIFAPTVGGTGGSGGSGGNGG